MLIVVGDVETCEHCGATATAGGKVLHGAPCSGQGDARAAGPMPDDALRRYDSAVATAAKADAVHRAAKRALIVAQIAEREARELANAATMAVLDLEAELRGERAGPINRAAPGSIVRV